MRLACEDRLDDGLARLVAVGSFDDVEVAANGLDTRPFGRGGAKILIAAFGSLYHS